MEPMTVDVDGTLRLRMRVRSGEISITETEAGSATVHITGERSSDEISVDREVSPSGTRLVIVQHKGPRRWGSLGETLRVGVQVPAGTEADIATGSADLGVDAPLGEIAFESGSGDARIAAISRAAKLTAASGDLRVDAIGGDATVTTASGDVEIDSIGGGLTARSASGDIEVGTLHGGARVLSASGDISIGVAHADLSLRSVSGDIEVGVAQGTRVWFDLSSTSGDTVSELEPTDAPSDSGFEISATSVSGDVRVKRVISTS